MAINHTINAILGAISNGQGSVIVVREWQALLAAAASGLLLCLGYRYALISKRMPAAMTPIAATCWTHSNRRHQRDQRWMSGVVVDPGTVGVA